MDFNKGISGKSPWGKRLKKPSKEQVEHARGRLRDILGPELYQHYIAGNLTKQQLKQIAKERSNGKPSNLE